MLDTIFAQVAIANAKSLDEVQRLEALLKSGGVPGKGDGGRAKANQDVEVEEEEMDTAAAANGVS